MTEHNAILDQAKKSLPATAPVSAQDSTAKDKIKAVEDVLSSTGAEITKTKAKLQEGQKISNVASVAITDSIKELSRAKQVISITEETASLGAQNAVIDAFNAAGGITEQTLLMSELNKDAAEVGRLLDIKADITDDEFTGIQIIDAAINDIRSAQTDASLDVARQQQAQTFKEITNITLATESIARSTALTKRTRNEATIEANLTAIKADTNIKVAEQQIRNVASNAQAFATAAAMDQRQVSNIIQGFRLQGEVKALELREEQQAFERENMTRLRKQWIDAKESREISLEQAKVNLEEAKFLSPSKKEAATTQFRRVVKNEADREQLESALNTSIQKAQSLAGLPIQSRVENLRGLDQRGPDGDKFRRLLEIGGSAVPTLGTNPFEAQQTRELIDPTGQLAGNKYTAFLNSIALKQRDKYTEVGAAPPKDPASLKADFNQTAKEFIKDATDEIKPGDNSNPYQSPPMSILADWSTAITNSTFFQKVIKESGMTEIDPQKIMDVGLAAIQAKLITPEELASGIETIFDAAALYNNTLQGGFKRVGLPDQTTFNVRLKRQPSGFFDVLTIAKAKTLQFGNIISPIGALEIARKIELGESPFRLPGLDLFVDVDLMDPTSVQHAVIKMLSGLGIDTAIDTDKEEKTAPVTSDLSSL